MVARPIQGWYRSPRQVRSSFQSSSQRQGRVLGRPSWRPLSFHNVRRRRQGPEPFEYSVLSQLGHSIFQIRTERLILGVLDPQQSVILSPKAKPTDRPTFCPIPGGRFQAASDATRAEAVSLDTRNLN